MEKTTIKKLKKILSDSITKKKINNLLTNFDNLDDNQINELSIYIIMYSLYSLLSDSILSRLKVISNDKPLTRDGTKYPSIGQCGIFNGNYITFFGRENKDLFRKGTKSSFYTTLVTFGHEFQHVLRKYQLESGIIDIQLFIIALEELNIELDNSFYIDHYRSLFSEIDADRTGIKIAYDFLSNYNDSVLEYNYKEFYKYMLDKSRFDLSLYSTNDEILDYIYFLITNVKKLLPSNLKLLHDMPILKIIYHDDGSFVTFEELKDTLLNNNELDEKSKDDAKLLFAVLYKYLKKINSSEKNF